MWVKTGVHFLALPRFGVSHTSPRPVPQAFVIQKMITDFPEFRLDESDKTFAKLFLFQVSSPLQSEKTVTEIIAGIILGKWPFFHCLLD